MKNVIWLSTGVAVALFGAAASKASINVPSDGSDGALVITNNAEIDLSQAVSGNWNDNNNAHAGLGIYDSNKWAVVFKYSSVTVQDGATITFKNHSRRAPVVWLVKGDVTINGTVNLNGDDASRAPAPVLAEPGPGGFRGGSGHYAPGASGAAGFGPGGGQQGYYSSSGWVPSGGGYGTAGNGYQVPMSYGNASIVPLLGGSGGGGFLGPNYQNSTFGGGGGGGAILIACSGTMSVSGTIQANGGSATSLVGTSGGSGGAVRLVCDKLAGSGIVKAVGGSGVNGGTEGAGGLGRIRLERVQYIGSLAYILPGPSVVDLDNGATPQIWLPTNGPSVKIVSIGGNAAPGDPRGDFAALGADLVLPSVTNTIVLVETRNVEQASVVTVRTTPRIDGKYSEIRAQVTAVVSEDPLVLRWTANVPVNDGYSAMQVKVVRP